MTYTNASFDTLSFIHRKIMTTNSNVFVH